MNLMDKYSAGILFYPLIIIILPFKTPRSIILIIAFLIGLLADIFYNSPGVHAATLVFTAYLRYFILKILEPRGGYRIDSSPTISHYGLSWFLVYSGILLFMHILVYYSIDAFTFVYIDKIIVNTMASFVVSYLLVIFYQVFIKN